MTGAQNLWITFFNFLPVVVLAIFKTWWIGALALIISFFISWILVFTVSLHIPANLMAAWAWAKPPVVAAIILIGGFTIF